MRPSRQRGATSPPQPRTRTARHSANASTPTTVSSPEPVMVMTCDGCGCEVGRDAALREEMNGDVAIYCGELCRAQREALELYDGADRDEPT